MFNVKVLPFFVYSGLPYRMLFLDYPLDVLFIHQPIAWLSSFLIFGLCFHFVCLALIKSPTHGSSLCLGVFNVTQASN